MPRQITRRRSLSALAAAPRLLSVSGDGYDYTRCLHAALRRAGVEVQTAKWSGRWLYAHVRRGDVVSFDWPSFQYYEADSRLRTWWKLLRFGALLALLRLRGARIAWTAHNLYPHDGGRDLLVHRIGRRIIVGLAAVIGVHGASAAARVQREFGVPARKLVLLEHGHWVGFHVNGVSRSTARGRLGIAQDACMFLFVGHCRPYKNLEALIQSHRELADTSELWIVGRFHTQDYLARITRAAQDGGAGRVTVRDAYVPDEELQLYLNACDVVVLPYREILTSGAAMLAMSFGRPVVAPRLGTLAEVVSDACGVLYDPAEPGALAAAMRAARARQFAPAAILARAQQFSWDRSAQSLATRLRELP